MSGNSFGQAFRITTAGESHGPGNVVIIDGCPPGIPLSIEDLKVGIKADKPAEAAGPSKDADGDSVMDFETCSVE